MGLTHTGEGPEGAMLQRTFGEEEAKRGNITEDIIQALKIRLA